MLLLFVPLSGGRVVGILLLNLDFLFLVALSEIRLVVVLERGCGWFLSGGVIVEAGVELLVGLVLGLGLLIVSFKMEGLFLGAAEILEVILVLVLGLLVDVVHHRLTHADLIPEVLIWPG